MAAQKVAHLVGDLAACSVEMSVDKLVVNWVALRVVLTVVKLDVYLAVSWAAQRVDMSVLNWVVASAALKVDLLAG